MGRERPVALRFVAKEQTPNLSIGILFMSVSTILLIVLILLLIGALPAWPYSGGWGYYPSGGLGLVVIILLILLLTGKL